MDVKARFGRQAAMHQALGEAHRLAIVHALDLGDRTPKGLSEALSLPMNLVAFHLSVLEAVDLVERRRSSGDGRRRYVRLRHEVIEELVDGLQTREAPAAARVLFICSHNSARSQLAAALWRGRTGRVAQSAGSQPARRVHPLAVAVAGSRGVDLSTAVPRGLDSVTESPDLVVTVCDRALESGTPFPGAVHIHWSIDDPVADGRPAAFAKVYDDVAVRVEHLAERTAA